MQRALVFARVLPVSHRFLSASHSACSSRALGRSHSARVGAPAAQTSLPGTGAVSGRPAPGGLTLLAACTGWGPLVPVPAPVRPGSVKERCLRSASAALPMPGCGLPLPPARKRGTAPAGREHLRAAGQPACRRPGTAAGHVWSRATGLGGACAARAGLGKQAQQPRRGAKRPGRSPRGHGLLQGGAGGPAGRLECAPKAAPSGSAPDGGGKEPSRRRRWCRLLRRAWQGAGSSDPLLPLQASTASPG